MLNMSKLLAAASMVAAVGLTGCASTHEPPPIKSVYHINDSVTAMAAMNNIKNQLAASPKDQIVVVTHGKGIDFLLQDATDKDGNPYQPRIDELMAKKVDFRVCNNTLKSRKLEADAVVKGANIVPSGVAEVAKVQAREGYTYIKP
ncbi:MAG: DsrE family protein [Pseudomonadota bacterium]